MPSFEEEYFDALQTIERAITRAYSALPEMKDRHAEAGLGALVRYYNAAIKGKNPPSLKIDAPSKTVFDTVKHAVEAMMMGDDLRLSGGRQLTVEEGVQCLKRIRRSISQMTKMHGPSGTTYLEFVKGYADRDTP